MLHRTGAGIIREQDGKEKPQGIRPVWDDAGRQDGMGMPAGWAEIPGDRDGAALLGMAVPLHQIPLIVPEQAQVSLCPAERTWGLRMEWCLYSIFIPLFI